MRRKRLVPAERALAQAGRRGGPGGDDKPRAAGEGFWRLIAAGAVLAALLVAGERYVRLYLYSADAPRPVASREQPVGEEARAIEIYRQTVPSVAYIFTRQAQKETGETAAGTGSGFVW